MTEFILHRSAIQALVGFSHKQVFYLQSPLSLSTNVYTTTDILDAPTLNTTK